MLKKCISIFLFVSGAFGFLESQDFKNYIDYQSKAQKAYETDNYKEALEYFTKIYELNPGHPYINYYFAQLHTLLGNNKEALLNLGKAVENSSGMNAESDSIFFPLFDLPNFTLIRKKIDDAKKPINNSTTSFSLDESDLSPEGIAYNPVKEDFYLSSTNKCKVKKIDKTCVASDFTEEKQDGLRTTLGMKIDPEKRFLWVCSMVGSPPPGGVNEGENGWSGVFKYDLNTEKMIKKYELFKKGEIYLFNDLVFTAMGDVFITDSEFGALYKINHTNDELELFLKSEMFRYPNVITISPDEHRLYMADSGMGIFVIDIESKRLSILSHSEKIMTCHADGLYFYRNSLIAVQNFMGRISRFYLNDTGDKIKRMEIIEANNPLLDIPTTGTIVDNEFYYIANCPLRYFNEDGSLAVDKVKNVLVMKADLK